MTPTKPSGIPWLGEVPAHWEVKRLKDIADVRFSNVDKKTEEGEISVRLCNYTDVYYGHYLDGTPEYMEATATRSEIERFKLRKGDVLITKDSESPTDIAIAAMVVEDVPELVCGYHLAIIRADRDQIEPAFLYWQLLSDQVREQYYPLANGITRFALGHGEINGGTFVVPPLPEQRAIAAFLDERTARIDALVARKRRLVQLLKEKRQALITRAVTRGLDPKVKMKESGVPFTTQMPAHWSIPRVKHVAELHTGITLGKQFPESMKLESRPYLRVANVQDGWLKLDHITEIELPPKDIPHYELQPGDVLMTEGGDFDKLGRGTVWEGQIPGCLHQNHIYAVRTDRDRLDPYFLSFLLSSGHGRSYFTSNKLQTTNLASTNGTIIKALPVLLPPIQEQRTILDWLNDRLAKLDGVVTKVEQAVERLQEYRTALISAAVTGKVSPTRGA